MNERSAPRISVVTVCLNSVTTIAEALDSVALQAGVDIEHIVIDGASTDGTLELLESRRERIATLVSERDEGLYHAMNKGIALATGDVIGFLNADDAYADGQVLARIARAFGDAATEACYGDLVYVDKADPERIVRYWKSRPYRPGLVESGWMPAHPTFFVRTAILRELGGFDTRYRYQSDFELMIRLFAKRGLASAYIPEILVRMRAGGHSNRSIRNVVRGNFESWSAARAHGIATSPFWVAKKLSHRIGSFFARPSAVERQRLRERGRKP
jgi:glycosyltransferase involved in cell wall biosynthesis